MRRLAVSLVSGIVTCAALAAFAQPADPPPPAEPAPQPLDEAKVRELVDREMARVLNERAAKEAAERAAKEQVEKDAPAASSGPTDLTGSSGFMDTRLAFTVTNENVLVKPGETIPSVPGWRFGTPNSLGVLFFDNYDTRYSGFETLTHAVAYRNYHKGHFDAEGALVIRVNEISEKTIELSDAGTYITLSNWKDPSHKDPTRISLTAFPVSSDRMRLGYSYRLSWGGSPEYRRVSARQATPGLKFQYDTKNMYGFVGAKTAVLLDRETSEEHAEYALLGGFGVDPTDMLRVEFNGGYFDRGNNELIDVNDQKVQLYGASMQVALHKGMPVQSSVDYKLYKNNNERVSGLFNPVKYPGGISWLAMAELTMMGQTLKHPEMTGTTTVQKGYAADLNVRVMLDRVRIRFDASMRTLAYILHSQPSLPTYSDFPSEYSVEPDYFMAIGFDRNWNDFLTLGAIFGVDKPATLTSSKGIPGGMTGASGESTAVIRNNNIDTLITILPVGEKAVPQFAAKGSAKLDFGRIYSAVVEIFYSYDGNVTHYQRIDPNNPESPFEFEFGNFNQLGLNATLQARF
jgi:hypothetical protein